MAFYKYKGKRIRASDKSLVYRFCGGSLLLLFVAVILLLNMGQSLGLPPNSLDTESSIKQGCKYFSELLASAKGQGIEDINAVIQSYNYGGGYLGYVAGNGKKHSFTLAENFSRDKSGGKKVTYTNPIAVARNGGWRYNYGNMFYVEL